MNANNESLKKQIKFICKFLLSNDLSENDARICQGFYTDNKVKLHSHPVSDYTTCEVRCRDGTDVRVFECEYDGENIIYRTGKWEQYLNELWDRANKNEEQRKAETEQAAKELREQNIAPAPIKANQVFY